MALSYRSLSHLAKTTVGTYLVSVLLAVGGLYMANATVEGATGCSVVKMVTGVAVAVTTRQPKVRGVEKNEAKYVLKEYNAYAASEQGRRWAERCISRKTDFQEAAALTAYPVHLLMGVAFVEGEGCQFVQSPDGGYGPAQITMVDKKHRAKAAKLLGIPVDQLNWKTDYLHNIVLGAVVLVDYETRLGSRGPGLLAYNTGVTAVRGYMDKAGRQKGQTMTLSLFRGTIPEAYSDGSRPRRYADRVLAGALIVSRVDKGLPLVPLEKVELADIPGATP